MRKLARAAEFVAWLAGYPKPPHPPLVLRIDIQGGGPVVGPPSGGCISGWGGGAPAGPIGAPAGLIGAPAGLIGAPAGLIGVPPALGGALAPLPSPVIWGEVLGTRLRAIAANLGRARAFARRGMKLTLPSPGRGKL
jgi:hypothetical protein